MAFCGKCGQKIEEGIKFCPACGAPVEVNATQSAQSQQPAGGYNQADIEQNKVMAVLAYFGILVLIPIFAAKESSLLASIPTKDWCCVLPLSYTELRIVS